MPDRRKCNRTYKEIIDRMYFIVWLSDLLAVRMILATAALMYGTAISVSPHNLLVGSMINIFPATIWGALFVVQGLVLSWSILCNKKPNFTLWLDAVLGSALWTSSTISCLLYQFPDYVTFDTLYNYFKLPPNIIPDIGIMAASWWALIRHSVTTIGAKNECT